jgi:transposase
MQDNAPIHRAHVVLNWFVEIGVNLADHPPYSPDLNPIGNLWKLLKAKIIELYPGLITMKDNA